MQPRFAAGPAATLDARIREFLDQRRIAVSGVSRTRQNAAALIYRKLKASGHEVFAVNPNTDKYQGDPCYADLASIPGGVDAVVIVNRPQTTDSLVRQCAEVGVTRVWMHQSLLAAGTSVSKDAIEFCGEHGISAIGGACPMMYCPPVDFGHRCMRWMLGVSGGLPK